MLIAHDLGTSGDKASLYALDGTLVASVTESYPTSYGPGTESEQDPQLWWRAVVTSTRRLLADSHTAPEAIAGICVGGTMMAVVCLDASGEVLRPAMIWSDQRAAAQAERLRATVGDETGYAITGNRLAATYNLPKLMWLAEHEPDVMARTYRAVGHKDAINARLTGIIATDVTDASSTAAYDLAANTWSDELIAAAGVESRLMPLVVPSTSVLGNLTRKAADELGLTTATQVIAGGGDGPMAAAGAGCVVPGDPGYVCLGTSAWYSRTTSAPVLDPLQRSFTLAHVIPDLYVPTATTQAGAGTLEWLRDSIAPDMAIKDLVAEGLGTHAAGTGLFFLPYLTGERSPWWNPHASGVMAGLRRTHGRAELARAVLEGVGYGLALCMEPLVRPGEPVDVVGGGSDSDGWLALLADIWDRPVRRRSVTAGATSLGVAATGLVGLGALEFGQAPGLSTIEAEFLPTAAAVRHREHQERFVAAYLAMEPWFGATS
ncbi:MAG TPA: FGGY-family carbohydrate kinase [Propionibacteriaceae bacterium]|nr:FGGY-family carbohydrate kinase [Propionibacteriaceae bacterium]